MTSRVPQCLLAMDLPGFFTIPHFNNYPALLIALKQAKLKDVKASLIAAFDTAATKKPKPKKQSR